MKRIALLLFLAAALLASACQPGSEIAKETPEPTPSGLEILTTPEPTRSPAQIPTAEPAPTPAPTPEEPPGVSYKSRVHSLNVRSSPNQDDKSNIIGEIGFEDPMYLLEDCGEFSHVQFPDGSKGYCYSEFIVPADAMLYAYLSEEKGQKIDIPTGNPVYENDGITPVMVKNELVDLRLYLPDAEYEMLFATDRNIIGEPLYPKAIPLIQRDTAKKLQKAFERFQKDGYTLKIYDAYRPISVQRRLFKVVKNRRWIADPDTTASNHNRGAAVDIALLDKNGEELEFPTPMHTFTEESARTSDTWSEQARANVDYMTKVMKESGFNSITSEWWHYSDTKSGNFMTTDIDLGRLTMLPKQD